MLLPDGLITNKLSHRLLDTYNDDGVSSCSEHVSLKRDNKVQCEPSTLKTLERPTLPSLQHLRPALDTFEAST